MTETIVKLQRDPSYPSLRVKKVQGSKEDVWEASVDMSRRLTFQYSDDGATIVFRKCNGHEVLRRM